MSAARKYAELLDIDPEAQDVFETPDLTDDTSTIPTSPPESSTDEIDRHAIDPEQARAVFLPAAEGDPVPGSRIASKRRGYRSSSRWREKDGLEVNGDELSSDEEEEGLERKLARLRREIAEVKGEVERQKSEREEKKKEKDGKEEEYTNQADAQDGVKDVKEGQVRDEKEHPKKQVYDKKEWITGEEVDTLSEVLNSVASTAGIGEQNAATKFTKRLALAQPPAPPTTSSTGQPQHPPANSQSTTYALTYAPTYNQTHTLSQITSFDTRLSALESLLGIDTLPLPTQLSSTPPTKPLLPTLILLSSQLTTLNTAISSPTALDTLTRRVRALATETQSLQKAGSYKPPGAGLRESHPSGTSTSTPPSPEAEPDPSPLSNPDTLPKLHALHALLPTITSLAPLLPPTLDRLRSLRTLHAEAAAASQTLRLVEERQEAVLEEVKGWRKGLEGVERKVVEAGEKWEGNARVVEGWVRELEGRLEGLGGGPL